MTTTISPNLAALILAIGLVFSLGCYLISNLSPGGMITPGWIALGLVQDVRFGLLALGVVVVTYATAIGIGRFVILYGKRLFAAVLALGVFYSTTCYFTLASHGPTLTETGTVGLIVPGLIAYQLLRQPFTPTLVATTAVTALTYSIILAGIVLGLVDGGAAELGSVHAPALDLGSAKLTLLALLGALALGLLAVRLRQLGRASVFGEVGSLQPAFALAGAGGLGVAVDRSSLDAARLARLVSELPHDDRRRLLHCLRESLEDVPARER